MENTVGKEGTMRFERQAKWHLNALSAALTAFVAPVILMLALGKLGFLPFVCACALSLLAVLLCIALVIASCFGGVR